MFSFSSSVIGQQHAHPDHDEINFMLDENSANYDAAIGLCCCLIGILQKLAVGVVGRRYSPELSLLEAEP